MLFQSEWTTRYVCGLRGFTKEANLRVSWNGWEGDDNWETERAWVDGDGEGGGWGWDGDTGGGERELEREGGLVGRC